jgi:predicted dienelactone hydrolase
MRSVSVVLTWMALLAVAGCASNSGTIESPQGQSEARYSPEPGSTPVGVIPDARLRDEQRNKDLDMSIDYPTRGGPYPVIILSHGFGGSKSGYVGLAAHWASNGYVVIRPTHADSGALRQALAEQREANPDRTMRERIDAAETVWEAQTPADWENRVRDIRMIIDSFDSLAERYPELRGRLDSTRVGVAGHSYGAFTAMLIGGARSSLVPSPTVDPRVRAVVAMSPPGTSTKLGLTAGSFRDVTVPIMYMTGTEDRGMTDEETPEWRREAFELGPPGEKYLVVIQPDAAASGGAPHARDDGSLRSAPARSRAAAETEYDDGRSAPGAQSLRGREDRCTRFLGRLSEG